MDAKERFHAVMNYEKPDRLPLMEFMGFWPETLERWHQEGLPQKAAPAASYIGSERRETGKEEVVDLREFFGFDRCESLPVDFNFVPAFERKILEEDEETRVVRDEMGVVKKEFKTGSAMPHYMEFPIKSRQDFLALKERLDPESPERYPANWPDIVAHYKKRDFPVYVVCRGPFAFGRDFVEFSRLMMAYAAEPEWIREMVDFHTDFVIKFWDRALSDLDVDFIYLGEDMAYKNGPMVSPAMVREFLLPSWRRMVNAFSEYGVKHVIIDSDGDVRPLIPIFLEAGVTGTLPLECAAGCDPVAIREEHPGIQMIGGLNKMEIARGGEVMEREVRSKVGKLAAIGGYIPSFDHSVHPLTSFQVYQDYLNVLKEEIGKV